MPLMTLLGKQTIHRLMQECRKWYLRPYCIKPLVHVFFFALLTLFTPFFWIFWKLKDFNFKNRCKMCVWTHILIFHQKLKIAKNVTYHLIAFSRQNGTSYVLADDPFLERINFYKYDSVPYRRSGFPKLNVWL